VLLLGSGHAAGRSKLASRDRPTATRRGMRRIFNPHSCSGSSATHPTRRTGARRGGTTSLTCSSGQRQYLECGIGHVPEGREEVTERRIHDVPPPIGYPGPTRRDLSKSYLRSGEDAQPKSPITRKLKTEVGRRAPIGLKGAGRESLERTWAGQLALQHVAAPSALQYPRSSDAADNPFRSLGAPTGSTQPGSRLQSGPRR
jgi:hypothetical protein